MRSLLGSKRAGLKADLKKYDDELADLKKRVGATEIAKRLGIGRASVYRVLAA